MEYVKTFKTRGRVVLGSESIGADCRDAALGFMAGTHRTGASRWGKLELARWLAGPYAQATRLSEHGERTLVATEPSTSLAVDDSDVVALLASTRAEILTDLVRAVKNAGGALDFIVETIDRGLVRSGLRATLVTGRRGSAEGGHASGPPTGGTRDVDSAEIWFPVDGARIRLADRVRALFVADYLSDPLSYCDLHVCPRCDAVEIAGACRPGICVVHRRHSGIEVKHETARALASGEDD